MTGTATLIVRREAIYVAEADFRTDVLECRCEATGKRFCHPERLTRTTPTSRVREVYCWYCTAYHALAVRPAVP